MNVSNSKIAVSCCCFVAMEYRICASELKLSDAESTSLTSFALGMRRTTVTIVNPS